MKHSDALIIVMCVEHVMMESSSFSIWKWVGNEVFSSFVGGSIYAYCVAFLKTILATLTGEVIPLQDGACY